MVAEHEVPVPSGRRPDPLPGLVGDRVRHRDVADEHEDVVLADAIGPSFPELPRHVASVEERALLVVDDVLVPQVQVRPHAHLVVRAVEFGPPVFAHGSDHAAVRPLAGLSANGLEGRLELLQVQGASLLGSHPGVPSSRSWPEHALVMSMGGKW